jgi:hypothetical protein
VGRRAVGISAGQSENTTYTTLNAYTQINDVGLGYYATYDTIPDWLNLLVAANDSERLRPHENTPIVTVAKVIIGGILAVASGDRRDDRRGYAHQ